LHRTAKNRLMIPDVLSELELHAYVDGLLDGPSCRRVERYLAQWPQEAARVAAYRGQNRILKELFGPNVQGTEICLDTEFRNQDIVRGSTTAK
jgi:hypothetical protein